MKLAAIDIGTNSIHMVIVAVTPHGYEVIDRQKAMVKLGQGVFSSGRISDRAYAEALQVMRRFAKLAENRQVSDITAAATSATREAQNGGDLMQAIRAQTGIHPRVISGTEEAELILLAVTHAAELAGEQAMVLDIGGGSVEIAIGRAGRVEMTESLRLGVQRLLDRHGSTGPISEDEAQELRQYIRGIAESAVGRAKELGFSRVVGTSGTIRAMCELALLDGGSSLPATLNARVTRLAKIEELAARLIRLEQSQRAEVRGVPEQRADTIHLGAVLLSEILALAGADEITVSDVSLRDGLIWDYLRRQGSAGDSSVARVIHAWMESWPDGTASASA